MTTRYVALLRGINVGGNNLIKMSDLKAAFEKLGHADVATFIASGNVMFTAKDKPPKVVSVLEAALSKQFGYESKLLLRSAKEMDAVVKKAPKGFGSKPDTYRYDALFVFAPTTAKQVVAVLDPREGVDEVWAGDGVVYFQRLIAQATKSRLNKIVGTPHYKALTIRNWNTTSKLAALLNA